MKKTGFIFGLHGLVFSIFLIVNTIIDKYIYSFLEKSLGLSWAVEVADLIISSVLYLVIYLIAYSIFKYITINIKKEIINLEGDWYHVHIKKENDTALPVKYLRAGTTKIEQDLYSLKFTGENYSYSLDENGNIQKYESLRKNTGWTAWSIDWNGSNELTTCFKADTQTKENGEYTTRYGIHKLTIVPQNQIMKGRFADEFPSKNNGEIYFFREEEKFHKFIKDFFLEQEA